MRKYLFMGVSILLVGSALAVFAQSSQDSLPLTRSGSVITNTGVPGLSDTADGALARATNTRPSDAPAADLKGKIRLPPTIINIEDLSEMRLERDMTLRLLLPEIERARLRLDEPGRDPADRLTDGRKARSGKPGIEVVPRGSGPEDQGRKHVLSTFEITYGFFDTLGAMVSTGMESGDMAWQVSYRRKRDEGFEIDGKRLANSHRGYDSLVFDFAWNKNAFDLSTGVVFTGEMSGLQGNTNYSQLRNIGLDISVQAGYILSTVSRVRVDFLLGHGSHVLDHPQARRELENYSADASLLLAMQWADQLSLKTDIGIIFEESTSDDSTIHGNSITAFSAGSRFGFSLGPVSFSLGGRILAGSKTWLAPSVDANWRLSPEFSFFGDLGREVYFLRFRQSVLAQRFVSAELPSLPVDRLRMAGGTRWQPSSAFSLVGTLAYAAYKSYPGLEESQRGLYTYVLSDPDVTSLSVEARLIPGPWLTLKAGWQQRFVSEDIPWLADWELDSTVEFKIPDSGTTLGATLKIEGDRHLPGLGAYTLLDLRLQQMLGETSSIIVEARNLLGTSWRLRGLYAEPGLTLHAGISVRF